MNLLGSLAVNLTVLLFWIYLFLLTLVFALLGNFDHVVVSFSIHFLSNSKGDALFHRIGYDYFRAGWGDLRDQLRDVP